MPSGSNSSSSFWGSAKTGSGSSSGSSGSGFGSGVGSGGSLSLSSSSSGSVCDEETQVCVSYQTGPNPTHNITLTGSLNGGSFVGTGDFQGQESVTVTLFWDSEEGHWVCSVDFTVEIEAEVSDPPATERCNPVGAIFEHIEFTVGGDESWIVEVLHLGACPVCDPNVLTYYYLYEGEEGVIGISTLEGDLITGEFFDISDSGISLIWWEHVGAWFFYNGSTESLAGSTDRCDPTGEYIYDETEKVTISATEF